MDAIGVPNERGAGGRDPGHRDLGFLLANTGVQTINVRESLDRFEEIGVDWRRLLQEFAGWRDARPLGADLPPFAKIRVSRVIGGLDIAIAVDTLVGPREHGCLAESERELGDGKPFAVHVAVPTAEEAGGEAPSPPTAGRGDERRRGAGSASDAAEGPLPTGTLTLGEFRLLPSTAAGSPRPVTVIVDVGNSRTVVGIVEQGPENADLGRELTMLPLGARGSPRDFTEVIAESSIEMVFPEWDSDLNLVVFDPVRRARVREPWRLFRDPSVVRTGREARRLRFEAGFDRRARTGMSSPKRYLWSREGDDDSWRAHRRHELTAPLSWERYLAPLIGAGPAASAAGSLSRSDAMTLFLFELLLQAFAWINNPVYLHGRGDRRQRQIAHVLLTFPSGMVAEEVAIYETRARRAIDALHVAVLARHGHPLPALVDMYLDEGSAAQLTFVFDRTRGGAEAWQRWVRTLRDEADGGTGSSASVRIGCLDVGGGSIDASAVHYALQPDVIPFHLDCELEYVDGVSRGGDDVLRALVDSVLIPQLAAAMNAHPEELRALVYSDGRAGSAAESLAARVVQGLLYPLGVAVMRAAEVQDGDATISLSAVSGVDPRLLAEIPRAFEEASPGGIFRSLQQATIRVGREELAAVVEDTLGGVLMPLARALVDEGCDLIVFAGRLSALDAVVDVVQRATRFDRTRLIQLHRTEGFADILRKMPETVGHPFDAKLAVLFGAAVSECARTNRTLNGVKFEIGRGRLRERGHYWGIVTPEERCLVRGESILFQPLTGNRQPGEPGATSAGDPGPAQDVLARPEVCTRDLTGAAFVGRRLRLLPDLEASPVYEVAPRAPGHQRHRVEFRRVQNRASDDEAIVMSADGEPCDERNGPVRFRLKTIFTDEYWLDGTLREAPSREGHDA